LSAQWQDLIKPILRYIREKGLTSEEEIYKELQNQGASREDIDAALTQLMREGAIYSPKTGFYKCTW
jgi:DNA replicative helicase MCM subunit Mcm2 (Cdc46/Mcm family)